MPKPALGRGLKALTHSRVSQPTPSTDRGERIERLALDQIVSSPLQPRTEFRQEHLSELVESIREQGIVQPLIVRKIGDRFELIAGERRWRAARQLELADAPVIIRQATDREVLELALIENLQREDLNPIEEATAYERLHRDFGLTQQEISRRVGKGRASVANAMRLLALHPDVQGYLKSGRISVGHAKVLLSLKSPEEQKALAEEILRQGISVRRAERLAARHLGSTQGGPRTKKAVRSTLTPAIQRVQNLLMHRFSTRISITHGDKRGTITLEYYGMDDLNRLLAEMGISGD